MKKFFISCLAALILVSSIIPAAVASPAARISVAESNATTREEVEWVFRTTADGKNQMRLWSITYARWLTDWITIN